MIKILIDPGHGAGRAHNRGGVCFNEGDNNYHFSIVLKKELETYEGVQVDLTRKTINDNPELHIRSQMGAGYDLFLSEHSNAVNGKVRGSEIWDSVEKPNKALAQALVDGISKAFGHTNRGVKYRVGQPGYNYYGVLRFNQAKSSMIVENGFHDNMADCTFFKNNHQLIAKVHGDAIAKHYNLKKKSKGNIVMPSRKNLIMREPTATIEDMRSWARSKKAHSTFINLAAIFYNISVRKGVNPIVTYAQSAKETGYMKFGGVIDITYNNPCGMKTSQGGGNKDPNAHHKFKSWDEGIQAQVDHLALYAGIVTPNSPDPRHFPYLANKPIKYVEELSGKWAGSKTYGQEIVKLMREIENIEKTPYELAMERWKGWRMW